MKQKFLAKLVKNKANGQVNISLPKKILDIKDQKCIEKSKRAWITLEGFEDDD